MEIVLVYNPMVAAKGEIVSLKESMCSLRLNG